MSPNTTSLNVRYDVSSCQMLSDFAKSKARAGEDS